MPTNTSGEFERSLERLEAIVARLEKESPNLDESVALFREGRDLAKKCEKLLKDAQASIEAAANGEPPPEALTANAPGAARPSLDDGLPF